MGASTELSSSRLPRWLGVPSDLSGPEQDAVDLTAIKRWAPVIRAISRYFRPSYYGIEHIPAEGPALIVGNHGLFGFDGFFIVTEIFRQTGRLARGTGDDILFTDPITRRFMAKIGAIHGTPENAIRFLGAGHLVNVYPGGARDALKGPDELYKLQWHKSRGFIRVAMRAQVPIILHVGIGTDDTFKVLGKMRWTGRIMGNKKYDVPLFIGWGPFPRPVKFTYYLSEPITLDGGPDDVGDVDLVEANHRRVWEIGQGMLDEGVRRRRSIWTG